MNAVATLPVRANVDAAFERYCALVIEADADPALRVSIEHNVAIARAWREWRDLFLTWDVKQ